MAISDRAWFHRAYPRALRAWIPVREAVEGLVEDHPLLDRPVSAARSGLKSALGMDRRPVSVGTKLGRHDRLPAWLAWEWQEIRKLEPDVLAAGQEMARVPVWRYDFGSPVIDAYERLCAMTPAETTHVVTVPWLLTGGADLEALNYINALVSSEKVGAVVVLGTMDVRSPWVARLPQQATFIDLGRICKDFKPADTEYLLATYLVQLQPRVVHNINSDLAYRVLVRHAAALRAVDVKIFLSVFCFDYTPEGLYDGYQVRYLRELLPYVEGIFCDNARHLAELGELYAIEPAVLHTHRQPMELSTRAMAARPPGSTGRLRVLWAGRLDRQKRPDILLEVAERAESLPLDIDVYGDFVLDARGVLLERMKAAPNVTYRGSFDGLASIPTALYDVLLYTSQWDGMPNVLLEATSLGLPIIASDVGGIADFVRDGETGRLVTPFANIDSYVDCLADACRHPGRLRSMREQAQRVLAQEHSFTTFAETVLSVPGYVEGSS